MYDQEGRQQSQVDVGTEGGWKGTLTERRLSLCLEGRQREEEKIKQRRVHRHEYIQKQSRERDKRRLISCATVSVFVDVPRCVCCNFPRRHWGITP